MRLTRPNRHRLDPVRWPRRRLRMLLAATLVTAATGVVYAGSGPPDPDRCAATRTTATARAQPRVG